jgi:DNA repair protein RadA/Sms
MAKPRTIFVCRNCGYENMKWAGKCPECSSWNSFEETATRNIAGDHTKSDQKNTILYLNDHSPRQGDRLITGISELDRVLGGGIFPSSVALIAGDPGIGKSTLLLQMTGALIKQNEKVLYISAEESFWQIKNRASRLKMEDSNLSVLIETELNNILSQIQSLQPAIVVIDSIQAIYSEEIAGAPGNASQIRECSSQLLRKAKEDGWSLFLVGHITKEGGIAGPKMLEHMVDVVIYFEGDSLNQFRILRSLKNRFGPINEIGLFLMDEKGLLEVQNPSRLFVSQGSEPKTGSSIVCSFEGTRPILAEVQALVSRSNYGIPQRTVSGFDPKKLALILAILEKHCGLNFSVLDVFLKIAGGLRIDDPGIDLGISAAIYSSLVNKPLEPNSVYIGEIGLDGEIRNVSQIKRRIDESVKLGIKNIYMPFFGNEDDKYTGKTKPVFLKNISQLFNNKKRD